MLTSIALMLIFGIVLGGLFSKLKLPPLIGMIITGILLGPHVLNLIDVSVLNISAELRKIALVIILMRAGLSLDVNDLKRVGRPAVLMCFVPACFEMAACAVFAPRIFGITVTEGIVMGSVIAAVSPAVVVPRMIRIMEEGYGAKNSVPQLVLAGASLDDVFAIVVFTAFCALASGEGNVGAYDFISIPISIFTGIAAGILCGLLLVLIFRRIHMRDSVKALILLSAAFLLLELETQLEGIVPLAALPGVMTMGMTVNRRYNALAVRLSSKYSKLWVGAEIMLFVLVGAAVDIDYARTAGFGAAAVVLLSLVLRIVGVLVCMLRTQLTKRERIFCAIAYMPKATVQAAIGSVPLAMGLSCGQVVLTVSVLSILITAPVGAVLIDNLYKRLLTK